MVLPTLTNPARRPLLPPPPSPPPDLGSRPIPVPPPPAADLLGGAVGPAGLGPLPMPPMDLLAGMMGSALGAPPPAPEPPPPPPPQEIMQLGDDPLADPMMLMALMMAPQPEPNEPRPGPVYPSWYDPKDYPRPNVGNIIDLVESDFRAHVPLIKRFEDDYDLIHMKKSGVFSKDTRARDPFASSGQADEVNLIANEGSGVPVAHDIVAGSDDLETEAQQVEDALDRWREQAIEDHYRSGSGIRARDEWMSVLTYGRVVARLGLKVNDPESPFIDQLLDPATVFPTFDAERGLSRVTRKYRAKLAEVLAAFDPDKNRGVRNEIERASGGRDTDFITTSGGNVKAKHLRDWDTVEVREYWDRRWYVVLVESVEVHAVAHNYGEPPFVYQLTGLGAPAFTISSRYEKDARGRTYRVDGQVSIEDQGVSHIHYGKKSHAILEAIHTRGLLEIMKSANPPVVRYQTTEAKRQGLQEVSTEEGAVNPALMGEEQIQAMPTAPAPQPYATALGQIQRDQSTNRMPLARYGVNENSNVSGFALNQMAGQGGDKTAAHRIALEQFHAQVGARKLRMYADWGHLIGYPGQKGYLSIYRAEPDDGEPAMFELTPDTVRRVGIRVKTSLRQVSIESLAPLIPMAAQGIQLGVITADDILKLRGVNDRRRFVRRWEKEKLRRESMDHPKLKDLEIHRMYEESDDPRDKRIAQWWFENVVNAPPQGGGPGAPPIGPGGGNPLAPAPQLPPTTNGVSLPAMGGPAPGMMGNVPGPRGPVGPRTLRPIVPGM